MNVKRIFLSQPMFGYTEDQLIENRLCAKNLLFSVYPDVVVVDGCVTVEEASANMARDLKFPELYFLGRSLQLLATCDLIAMMDGWEWSRSCVVQKIAAVNYNIPIMYLSAVDKEVKR